MESAATKIEETTGIPKAGSLAVMETAMVTGVPGVKAVAKRVARNVNDLVNLNRMDPGSKEWTGKDKPWVVPETTDTGEPISTGAVTMPDGFYDIPALNNYLHFTMVQNKHYLVAASGDFVYFATLGINPTRYSCEINCFGMSVALAATEVWTLSVGATDCLSAICEFIIFF